MADVKVTDLAVLSAPTYDDMLLITDDPGGTPVSKSLTLGDLARFLGWEDVWEYGATGAAGQDPTTCTTAIQNAINAAAAKPNGKVWIPCGTYPINSTITLSGNVDFEGETERGTIFKPSTDTFHAFQNNITQTSGGRRIGNFSIMYTESGPPSSDTRAKAIYLKDEATHQYFISNTLFHHIYICGAYYGIYDDSYGWGNIFSNIYINYPRIGVYKQYGNNNTWENVFSDHHYNMGWDVRNTTNTNVFNCASNGDGATATGDATLLSRNIWHTNYSLTIQGFDIEGHTQETNYGSVMLFYQCQAMNVNGLFSQSNVLATGAANTIALIITKQGCVGKLSGRLFVGDSATGTGSAIGVWVVGTTGLYTDRIRMDDTFLDDCSGTGMTKYCLVIQADGSVNAHGSEIGYTRGLTAVNVETGGNFSYNNGPEILGTWTFLTANSATPSVINGVLFHTANTLATTLTHFADGVSGQRIIVVFADSVTTINFGSDSIYGDSTAKTFSPGDWIEAIKYGNYWYCSVHDCTP